MMFYLASVIQIFRCAKSVQKCAEPKSAPYGEVAPQQEKALEALGFDLPDPDKPLSRRNNRKITFDATCRKMLFEIAKRHGLDLEEEAEYGNCKYLEKQDFILAKQKEIGRASCRERV